MKNLIARALICIMLFLGYAPVLRAEEVPQKIHHFALIAPNTTKVGEAIDITVEARDKDDVVIPTYRGTIFFLTPTDMSASVPSKGNGITFTDADK